MEETPERVLWKVSDALNERGKPIKGSYCLVLGIAQQKNKDNLQSSPALQLMELLTKRGAHVEYSDPHVPALRGTGQTRFELESVELCPPRIGSYDLVLIATDHDAFDYAAIRESASLIVDTRGVYAEPAQNVFRA